MEEKKLAAEEPGKKGNHNLTNRNMRHRSFQWKRFAVMTASAAAAAILLFVAFPDPYRFTFELGDEINDVTKALMVRILGPETISGRAATKLADVAEEVSGGEVIIPEASDQTVKEPQVKVEVDLEAEANEQKSVDAGHSPWKLDPAFVAQVYASLLLSPEGIVGDYPIAYEDIKIISNDGIDAVAEINAENSIAKYVYLKRLIRQDDTGIWSVVGYDPAQ